MVDDVFIVVVVVVNINHNTISCQTGLATS